MQITLSSAWLRQKRGEADSQPKPQVGTERARRDRHIEYRGHSLIVTPTATLIEEKNCRGAEVRGLANAFVQVFELDTDLSTKITLINDVLRVGLDNGIKLDEILEELKNRGIDIKVE